MALFLHLRQIYSLLENRTCIVFHIFIRIACIKALTIRSVRAII
nr:MAG TPA: hypothetical protein [Caudoviricetes sp.]